YYWYYGTQVMHHYGGDEWAAWNSQMRDLLLASQIKKGIDAGSWEPNGGHASHGGRVYMTSLALLTLEVYYRHLPIYERKAARVSIAKAKPTLPDPLPPRAPPTSSSPESQGESSDQQGNQPLGESRPRQLTPAELDPLAGS
ncbi:MAG: hypothetical protein N2C14_20500, partial [Planctomycetales bacterium]